MLGINNRMMIRLGLLTSRKVRRKWQVRINEKEAGK